ncbi:MAG: hypothetical protein R3C01_06945 [Planctomycetaceae bacterium]
MAAIKRFLEWYLGVDPARPGEGSAWTLQYAVPGSEWFPVEICAGLILLAIGLIWWVYRRDAVMLSRRRRWGLMGLRIAVFFVLLLMLSRLSLQVEKTGLPNLAVLIDVSGSMGIVDRYPKGTMTTTADRLAQEAGRSETSRLAMAQGLLTGDDAGLLKSLSQHYRLQVSTFSQDSRPLVLPAGGGPEATSESGGTLGVGALTRGVKELQAEGSQTRPGAAVLEVLNDFRGGSLAAMVIFTDGVATTSQRDLLSQAAGTARTLGVPFYIVGLGSEEPGRDIELDDVRSEPTVFLGDPLTVQFRLRSQGYARREVEVTLREEGVAEPVASTRFTLANDGVSIPGELTYLPEHEGERTVVVEVTPLTDEVDAANNRGSKKVVVNREQLRVLYVERLPRWEYRALKPLLERDDAISVDTLLLDADLEFGAEDRTSLRQFPTTMDQLAEYDVVIWGDVDLNAMGQDVAEMLKEYVGVQGSGLILIAGMEFNPLSYRGTSIETLLPVYLETEDASLGTAAETPTGAGGAELPLDGSLRFRIERTQEGKSWPFLHLADTPARDTEAWNSLPAEFDWLADTPRKKPGAQVLAVHPHRQGVHGKSPVLAVQRYGRGLVLYQATDELWKWRRRVEDLYYGRYWSQAIRSLAKSRQDHADVATLTTDRSEYDLGDTVRLRLFLPEQTLPDQVERVDTGDASISLITGPGERRIVTLRRVSGPAPLFEGTIESLPIGNFRCVQNEPLPGEEPATCEFKVQQAQRELAERQMNRADLIEAARVSHGRFLTIEDASELVESLPAGRPDRLAESRPIPLWNRVEVLLLVTLLLGAEWIFRKQSRLV